jgi:[ribosomal protein S18]-alanine N-acetyltransferase
MSGWQKLMPEFSAVLMNDVTIRNAGFDDLDRIAALESASFPSPWKRHYFESELRAPGRFNRVAIDGEGALIGYLFSMHYADELHINKIAVAAQLRRRGLARLLMSDCLSFARENAITTLSLEVRQSNEPAQEFYRGLNFTSVYVRENYYPDGEAAVVMMAAV